MNFLHIFGILTGIPGNSFKVLQNSGIPEDFESAGFEILHKLPLSSLEIVEFFGTQVSVVHRVVWIFSGIAHYPLPRGA